MKDIAKRIASLPPDKQTVLLQRLRQKNDQSMVNQPPSDKWIVRYRQNKQAHLRLFCFSYAGGGASIFRQWPDALPSAVEVCCVQLPGHESRIGEAAYVRIAPLLEALADAIYPYLDRPFAFFGHSMGALVSFELARQLRRMHNRLPIHLYLAAYRAPHLPNPNIVKIYQLPSEVCKVVLRAEGIPEMILQNEEFIQAILPTLRADFELCDTYEYTKEAPLECPFSIFGGQEDVRISATDLDAWHIHSSVTSGLSMLPGAHFFLHSAQDLLLAAISQSLTEYLNLPVFTHDQSSNISSKRLKNVSQEPL